MSETLNVIIGEGEDGYLISEVVELPGCHTQARSHEELIKRTKEAIKLYLSVEEHRDDISDDEWLKAASRNPVFRFLDDPEEDIYSIEDGGSFDAEG